MVWCQNILLGLKLSSVIPVRLEVWRHHHSVGELPSGQRVLSLLAVRDAAIKDKQLAKNLSDPFISIHLCSLCHIALHRPNLKNMDLMNIYTQIIINIILTPRQKRASVGQKNKKMKGNNIQIWGVLHFIGGLGCKTVHLRSPNENNHLSTCLCPGVHILQWMCVISGAYYMRYTTVLTTVTLF